MSLREKMIKKLILLCLIAFYPFFIYPQQYQTNRISLMLYGEFPTNSSLVLRDSSGELLDQFPLINEGLYSFSEELFQQNSNYPLIVAIEVGSSTSIHLSTINFQDGLQMNPQIENIYLKHFYGELHFHPDMGGKAKNKYVFLKRGDSGNIRLNRVNENNYFDFYEISSKKPNDLVLYALYDTNGNAKVDFSSDIISYIAPLSYQFNNTNINETIIKLEGKLDPNLFSLGEDEKLYIKLNSILNHYEISKLSLTEVKNDGSFQLFISCFDTINLTLIKSSCNTTSVKDIYENSASLGVIRLPTDFSTNQKLSNMDIEEIATPQKYLILFDPDDPDSKNIMDNVKQAMKYANFDYCAYNIHNYNFFDARLKTYTSIGIATNSVNSLSDNEIAALECFVDNGGGLVFLMRGWEPRLFSLIGVGDESIGAFDAEELMDPEEENNNTVDYGVLFKSEFYPGISGIEIESWVEYLKYQVDDEAEVLFEGIRNGAPLLWRYSYGNGRVLYWNNSLLGSLLYRGMITQSFLDIQQVGIQPILKASTFIIDDYPLPMYKDYVEPLISEFGSEMNNITFFTKIWQKDMLSLADRYRFKYTFAIPFNYTTNTEPPWLFSEWLNAKDENQNPLGPIIGHELLAAGHELALHGYNHISLTSTPIFEGEPVWPNQENMISALEAAKQQWENDFDELPVTYIPPNNRYDMIGLDALKRVFPTIENLAGALDTTYKKEFYEHGCRTEFGIENFNPNFLTLPRYTSGYTDDQSTKWGIIAELSLLGLWTHYVHPDDIINTLDNNPNSLPVWLRNPDNLYWREDKPEGISFFNQLDNLLNWESTTFPWVDWKLTKDLNQILPEFNTKNVRISLVKSNNKISKMLVTSNLNNTAFMLRVAKSENTDNSQIEFINLENLFQQDYGDYYIYILKLTDFSGEIILN
jgi:hypothetical protein